MAGNKTLNSAARAKKDEFYTQIADLEQNFADLGLKKIIATCYAGSPEVTDDAQLDERDEAAALKNISTMPARVKCATLAWHTFDTAVKNSEAT